MVFGEALTLTTPCFSGLYRDMRTPEEFRQARREAVKRYSILHPERVKETRRKGREKKAEYQRNRRKNPEIRAQEREKHRKLRRDPEFLAGEQKRGREALADRRRKIQLLKMDRPCYDCGGTFDPEVMEWDHLPGTIKSFDLCRAPKHNLNDVVDEIAKCQLVCANCHRGRTIARRTK